MKNFDYLLMDADGTLFDFARAERRALTQVFQWAGIDDRQKAQELYLRINRALWDAFERGEVTKDQLQGGGSPSCWRPWTYRGMGGP